MAVFLKYQLKAVQNYKGYFIVGLYPNQFFSIQIILAVQYDDSTRKSIGMNFSDDFKHINIVRCVLPQFHDSTVCTGDSTQWVWNGRSVSEDPLISPYFLGSRSAWKGSGWRWLNAPSRSFTAPLARTSPLPGAVDHASWVWLFCCVITIDIYGKNCSARSTWSILSNEGSLKDDSTHQLSMGSPISFTYTTFILYYIPFKFDIVWPHVLRLTFQDV